MTKILVIGGTGALGTYLVPELVRRGNRVDVASLDDRSSSDPDLRYIKIDAKNLDNLKELLKNKYDAIVDFMLYYTSEFRARYELFLENTGHYIYLSTYRIYADSETLITEESARILETVKDPAYLAHKEDEYSLYKALGEDMLRASGYRNFTILRPSITYSKRRFQLVTLEAATVVKRMREGKIVILPEEAMEKQTTLTWAGDFAKMVAPLILNEKAFGETYTIATGEHHTWREMAAIYQEIGGLRYITVDAETYLHLWSTGNFQARAQLYFDRFFERAIDNSKILKASGLSQADLMPVRDGLRRELTALPPDADFGYHASNERMDRYLEEHGIR